MEAAMKATVETFETSSDKVDGRDLDENLEATEAVVERQELRIEGVSNHLRTDKKTVTWINTCSVAPPKVEETGPRKWKVPEQVGRRPCSAQGKNS
jgi:hypothetical protein